MRFSDFLDEASPTAQPSPGSPPSSTVTEPVPPVTLPDDSGPPPAHQHVLGPPPAASSDVSAFAELFGAIASTATPSTQPAVVAAPQPALSVQDAVDAIVVPHQVAAASPRAVLAPAEMAAPPELAEPAASIDHVIDDDLLPSRLGKGPKNQPARAWSLGRSKR